MSVLSDKLLRWYEENGRQLPWRGIDDAYRIWLSEIILQQTRIEQGRSYYEHFVTHYPTVRHLAEASEEQVLKSWQGLGYYSRARNLHRAAQQIAYQLGGIFPTTYDDILALPGVGRYTAAAITSFAFRLPYPVIDGNVYRFISRLYGIDTPIGTDKAYREFERLLMQKIDPIRPDLFNQATMDFGSTYCKPTGNDCWNCIFAQECMAKRLGKVELLPVKPASAKVTVRHFYYIDVRWNQGAEMMLVHPRGKGDIWQGLYELPLYETPSALSDETLQATLQRVLEQWFGKPSITLEYNVSLRHQLTHRTIQAHFWRAKYSTPPPKIPKEMVAIAAESIKTLPISRLIDKYLLQL